ncbi:hypothetical protein ACB092_01G192300 [Castanea dentata]
MRWVIEDEGNKKIQSNFTEDLVKLVTQGQVKSSQSHHNVMFEHHYQMSASISRWLVEGSSILNFGEVGKLMSSHQVLTFIRKIWYYYRMI